MPLSVSASPVSVYLTDIANESSLIARFQASDPTTKSGIAYLQQQAPKLTSPDALLKDYRSLQVVLGAYGMAGHIQDTALLQQLMTQNPSDASSLAYRSKNPLFQKFAQAMSNWTPPPFSDPPTLSTILRNYVTANFEQAQGKQTDGVQQALYFRRTIGSITSVSQIIADPTLLQVVATASGLPQQFGLLDYAQQVRILSNSVDLSKLKNQSDIDRFAERYLLMTQMNGLTGSKSYTATSTQTVDPALSLLGASTDGSDPILSLFSDSGGDATSGSLLSLLA